jgi:class 3 adenylate cyclase
MPELPTGTVTFVFSDLEGSTRLLKALGDEGYTQMLATQRRLVRETFAAHGGSEIDTQGDAFFYSFNRARAAVAAAVELQRRHETESWPNGERVRVRLGLHTGEPVVGEEGYTGLDVVRAARIAADGKGGQILLSESTRAIVGDDLPPGVDVRELGERMLKDLDKPEPLYELVYSDETPSASAVQPATGVPPAAVQPPAPPAPGKYDVTDPSDIRGWLDIARRAMREGDKFDPAPLIEERVLRQIERNTRNLGEFTGAGSGSGTRAGADPGKHRSGPPPQTPALPDFSQGRSGRKKSVADELERLRALNVQGALTGEQSVRAVDKVLDQS